MYKLTPNMVSALKSARYIASDADRKIIAEDGSIENFTGWAIIGMDGRTRKAMHNRGLMHGHYYLTAKGVDAARTVRDDIPEKEEKAEHTVSRNDPMARHYGVVASACGGNSERRTSYLPNVTCVECLILTELPADMAWNAEDIPRGWENATHHPNTDYDAAMSYPQVFYRGGMEAEARKALSDTLRHYATFAHIAQAGKTSQYLDAADAIMSGQNVVSLSGRHYRIRQGVSVNQTRGKGL